MSRLISVAATFVVTLWTFASHAVTLEPLPGSTPQTTCFSCVFPNPVGVIARDASGEPLAGVAVTFLLQGESDQNIVLVRSDDLCCAAYGDVVVMTGADGVAVGTVVTTRVGARGVVTASAEGAASVAFELSASLQRGAMVEVVGGNGQYVQSGTAFSAPWKVRVTDDAGRPVPNTMLTFYAGGYDATEPSATFNGNEWAFAVADADGIVTSPSIRAGAVVGDAGRAEAAFAALDGNGAIGVLISFHIVPYAITTARATLVSAPPTSLMTGTFAAAPYVVRLVDAAGQPAVGMPVTFAPDGWCGAFDGLGEQVVFSDAEGLARSGLLEASVPTVCNIRIEPAGMADAFVISMHVFDPNLVVVTPRVASVVAKTKQAYQVVVDFTESGMPIQPAFLEAVNALRDRTGPPAGFASTPTISIMDGSATIDLRANPVPGRYDLEIVFWGPSRAVVHVTQVP